MTLRNSIVEQLSLLKMDEKPLRSVSSSKTQSKWKTKKLSKEEYVKDYEKLWSRLGAEMQEAADCGDQHTLYQLMRKGIVFMEEKKNRIKSHLQN